MPVGQSQDSFQTLLYFPAYLGTLALKGCILLLYSLFLDGLI